MRAAPAYRVWFRDDAGCAEAIRTQEPVEVALSAYGRNDELLEFLVGSGLWGVLTGMVPDGLRKGNGKPWHALNGVEVLRELARVDRIAHCGKIVRDVRLMMMAGFNAEAVRRAHEQDQPVLDPETLANHLGRISPRSAAAAFEQHVGLMRGKRWIRGGTYAADAHEIIVPFGRCWERLGRVGEKYGYKLVVVLNIKPSRERVVGFVLAPLDRSERGMLRIILRALARRFGALGSWMKTLVLDRGYWGARYLLGLKARYGIDLVTRAQHDELTVVKDIDGLLQGGDVPWQWRLEEHSHLGRMEVRCAGWEGLDLRDQNDRIVGQVNAVAAEEYEPGRTSRVRDEQGRVRPRFDYITTLPSARNPARIRAYYRMRWTIENQGFREMTQQWALDVLAGRRFNVLNSRIAFALMLYNAEHVFAMQQPELWRRQRERQLCLGERSWLGGPSLAAYTRDGRLGLFTPDQYGRLIAERERNRIVRTLREGLARGETLERTLERIQDQPPRQA
jgi:hypothetical protein